MEMIIKWNRNIYCKVVNASDIKSLFVVNTTWQRTYKNYWKRDCSLSCTSVSTDYPKKIFTTYFSKIVWIVGTTPKVDSGNASAYGKEKEEPGKTYEKWKAKILKLPHNKFQNIRRLLPNLTVLINY